MVKLIPVCKVGIVHMNKVKKAQKVINDEKNIFNIAETFKILSDPTRLKIVLALKSEELCVCDVAALINLSESAVSHQLRLLKSLRIVKYRRSGKLIYYSLDDKHIESLLKAAAQHICE